MLPNFTKNEGFISNEPGILIPNTVVEITKSRTVPLLIVNSTNKIVHLKKNCIIAKAKKINEINAVQEVNSARYDNSRKNRQQTKPPENWVKEIKCSKEHKDKIEPLLLKNKTYLLLVIMT